MKRYARIALAAIAILFYVALLAAVTPKAHAQTANFFSDYEAVAVSATDQALGNVGTTGDILQYLVITVSTSATSTVSIKDGSGSAIVITAANTPIGVYTVLLGARSTSGAWKVTTGAGASVLAVGRFR